MNSVKPYKELFLNIVEKGEKIVDRKGIQVYRQRLGQQIQLASFKDGQALKFIEKWDYGKRGSSSTIYDLENQTIVDFSRLVNEDRPNESHLNKKIKSLNTSINIAEIDMRVKDKVFTYALFRKNGLCENLGEKLGDMWFSFKQRGEYLASIRRDFIDFYKSIK